MNIDPVEHGAMDLIAQHAERKIFTPIEKPALGDPLAFAYDVQDRFINHFLNKSGASIAGYKIGLTTPRMQAFAGIPHPIAGVICSDRILYTPAELDSRKFGRLGLECEVAVRIAKAIDGSPRLLQRSDVQACIGAMAPAFEIIDDRNADYSCLDSISLVADNSWNAGIVLGELAGLPEIGNLDGRLAINGLVNDGGNSADVLGHPFDAVAWLAEHLASRGRRLEAGQWIMTGSIVSTKFPKPGDVYEFNLSSMEPVTVRIK